MPDEAAVRWRDCDLKYDAQSRQLLLVDAASGEKLARIPAEQVLAAAKVIKNNEQKNLHAEPSAAR